MLDVLCSQKNVETSCMVCFQVEHSVRQYLRS